MAFFSDANIIKSKVSGSLADSPFGQFFAPGLDEGTDVEIVIRPQHVRIDFDREGKDRCPRFQWVFQCEAAWSVPDFWVMRA